MSRQAPQDDDDELYESISAKSSHTNHRVYVPKSDLDVHIKFSWFRCLFSVFGYLLVLSDIPRTGYGIRVLSDSFTQVAPGTVLEFGPYVYAIARIQKTRDGTKVATYNASCDAKEITDTAIWPYKYDSLSIALRGIARQLGVLDYPRCLQYKGECASQVVSLEVTFTMLDALVTSLHKNRYQYQNDRLSDRPYVFQTKSYWVDRLHHYLFSKFQWHRIDTRLHTAHYYQGRGAQGGSTLRLCNPEVVKVHRPTFCNEEIAWAFEAASSANSSQVSRIKASEHIAHRLSNLERQYPHLQFDLTVLTTQWRDTNARLLRRFPVVYYQTVQTEILTIIRGRLCTNYNNRSSNATEDGCVTSLIDDFRYERSILATNAEDWYNVTRVLRATSQTYVWLRIASLFIGCYVARRGERKFVAASVVQRIYWVLLTVFKIPSHVIIYGSWVPIILYVVAHLIDCGLVHLLCELVWASMNGSVHFKFLKYVQVASVQMRNVWLLALVVKSLIACEVYWLSPRCSPWLPRHGLVGIRGGLISLLSSLTIFSYLRFVTFRSLKIIEVHELSAESFNLERIIGGQFDRMSEFGFFFDLRTISFATAVVTVAAMGLKLNLLWFRWWSRRRQPTHCGGKAHEFYTRVLFTRTHYVPYSIGTLAPLTALSIFWRITVLRSQSQQAQRKPTTVLRSNKVAAGDAAVQEEAEATDSATSLPREAAEHTTNKSQVAAMRKASSFLVLHEVTDVKSIFRVEKRSRETWSVVQLINIALLTEPLALLNLFVVGQDLYLYQVNAHKHKVGETTVSLKQNLILLPCDPETLARNTIDSESLDATAVYELVDIVSSKSVPWRLLVFCG